MPEGPVFLPGVPLPETLPLARFLPPLLVGPAAEWAARHVPRGAWLLDPFGASPSLPLELAKVGFRVLVAANNPVIRLLAETFADPPPVPALQSALAHLADSRIGDERLEPHLLAIYRTTCDQCGSQVSADEFIWERGAAGPFARIYHCPNCQHLGEHPAGEADIALARRSAATPLHVARALARVAAPNDPNRRYAEEALGYYPPRAVYAIFSLINRLETLPERDQQLLFAPLLMAFDRTNTLWPYPSPRPRPRQLTIPPRYYDRNVFRELERAIQAWQDFTTESVQLTHFPELPQGAGICLYEGRIRYLSGMLAEIGPQAVVTVLPRPNQAFWTLSALWAGWLWGRSAVEPFKSVLRRQRYDWRWHTTALHAAFNHLRQGLPEELPTLAMLAETEAGFLSAAVTASQTAGWPGAGIALRPESGQTQLQWHVGGPTPAPESLSVENIVRICRQHLQALGEPSGFNLLLAALLAQLDLAGELGDGRRPSDLQAALLDMCEQSLTYRGGFLRYGAGKELDVGTWWLREDAGSQTPLSDRLEAALRDMLQADPGRRFSEIDSEVCARFPGLLTPEEDLVVACLQSYGQQDSQGGWSLRPEDEPGARRAELGEIAGQLIRLGERLGFQVEGGIPIVWSDLLGTYSFYITTSAAVGGIVYGRHALPGQPFIVVPGSRANLILHKRQRDPRLDNALKSWRFLKFRALRRLAESPITSRANVDEQLRLDDFQYESLQIRLL